MFTWIPIHREASRRILDCRNNQGELLAILGEMKRRQLKVINLEDKTSDGRNSPLSEIDPFTFLASFNRAVTNRNRRDNWNFLKEHWGLEASVPDDFTGIPILHPMRSRLMPWEKDRDKDHVALLWEVAAQGADDGVERIEPDLFDRCVNLDLVGIASLTIGLFWMNPEKFLATDKKNVAYGRDKGVTTEPTDYRSYRQWLEEMTRRFGTNYPQISHEAHLFAMQGRSPGGASGGGKPAPLAEPFASIFDSTAEARSAFNLIQWALIRLGVSLDDYESDPRVALTLPTPQNPPMIRLNFGNWVIFTFRGAEGGAPRFETLCREGRAERLEGCKRTGKFSDKIDGEAILTIAVELGRLQVATDPATLALEDALALVSKRFADWKASPYRNSHKPELLRMVFDEAERDRSLRQGLPGVSPPPPVAVDGGPVAYWWLNANPKIWNFEDTPVGQRQTYTSHNERGNKRQRYKCFQEVKPGDMVIGYVTSPQREVVAVCKITKGLHQTENGEGIEFEKVEQLLKPVAYETLQANPDLAKSEPLINNQGSLFRLTVEEYEIIRSLIDEANIATRRVVVEPYSKQKAMKGLFLAASQFDEMLAALREKRNVVLQGAPGVGKTYVAKRLAYALIGSNDPQQIEMIQFHQSYSYEDFIQGFRPTPKGHFDLKYGIFHQFCRRAQRDESQGKPYVFIIDEINRGNLSKIFGELMMLIEPDKRGNEHAIPLAYSQDADDKFYIPENLHLIGMMNTADRSLAMVDYALRRRFRFITLLPEFSSKTFRAFLADTGAKSELVEKIIARMNALNEAIAADIKNLGPGYQIGHSYFCPRNGITPDNDWYCRVIRAEIIPLIQEYWFDNEQKVKEQQSALLA